MTKIASGEATAKGPRPAPAAAAPTPERRKLNLKPRFNAPITDDKQRFAVDAMQADTREQLKRLLLDPELPAALGLDKPIAPAASSPPGDGFTPELAGVLFDAIGRIAAVVAVRRFHYRADLALECLGFTPAEKAQLSPLACKVLDKWFPGGLGKYADEIALGALLVHVIQAKIELLRARTAAAPVPQATPADTKAA